MNAHLAEPGASAAPVPPAVLRLLEAGLPVLRMTAEELARLRGLQERAASAALCTAVLRDPLFSLRVLRFLSSHRTRSQSADITTVGHALIMLGQTRFLREFEGMPVLEDSVAPEQAALVHALASRARLASLLARDLAVQRHDVEPEEIMLSALLNETPAILLALVDSAPGSEPIDGATRSHWLGAFGVPALLAKLNGADEGHDPRIASVGIACRLARACSGPWRAEEIAVELAAMQRYLRTSPSQAWERVRRVLLQAAREWHDYATLPAARYLPFIVE